MNENWILGAEYYHIELADKQVEAFLPGKKRTRKLADISIDTIVAKLIYKFN